jgi:hypothetical protein
MRRNRPDPDQSLFRWAWDADPCEPPPEEDHEPASPPLRDRVLARYAPAVMRELWGVPVIVRKADAPTRPSGALSAWGSACYSPGPCRTRRSRGRSTH